MRADAFEQRVQILELRITGEVLFFSLEERISERWDTHSYQNVYPPLVPSCFSTILQMDSKSISACNARWVVIRRYSAILHLYSATICENMRITGTVREPQGAWSIRQSEVR